MQQGEGKTEGKVGGKIRIELLCVCVCVCVKEGEGLCDVEPVGVGLVLSGRCVRC